MKYCSHCGKELMDAAVVCPNCGCAVNGAKTMNNATGQDVPSAGLNILAFCVPLAGLIMFCVMQNNTPRKAKQIGLFALIGFGIAFLSLIALAYM